MAVDKVRGALGKVGAVVGLLLLGTALLTAVLAGVVVALVPFFLM